MKTQFYKILMCSLIATASPSFASDSPLGESSNESQIESTDKVVAQINHPGKKTLTNKMQPAHTDEIMASELAMFYRPVTEEFFKKNLELSMEKISTDKELQEITAHKGASELYRDYLQEELDYSAASLVLAKILDDEADRWNVRHKVIPDMVNYTMRSFLEENARQMGLEPSTRNEGPTMSNQELYDLFKARIAETKTFDDKPVPYIQLRSNWNYDKGGMKLSHDLLNTRNYLGPPMGGNGFLGLDLGGGRKTERDYEVVRAFTNFATLPHWPAVTFTFSRNAETGNILPEDIREFEKVIQGQLNRTYRQIVRREMLEKMLVWYVPKEVAKMNRDISFSEMDRIYNEYLREEGSDRDRVNGQDWDEMELTRKIYRSEMLINAYKALFEELLYEHKVTVVSDVCENFPDPCVHWGAVNPQRWIKSIFQPRLGRILMPKMFRSHVSEQAYKFVGAVMNR